MWIFITKIPIKEDQTLQKFLINNLEQISEQNNFKCEFYKKSSWSKLIEVRNLIFERSDHHGLPGHADFKYAFYQKSSYLSGSKKPKFLKLNKQQSWSTCWS